ncbi:MAG TPA: DUF4230 domain-containing protein [Methylomirabilota bacterium]|nr:DUF4230 domain-containing protein [Methylomirabilota bacterium]
MRKTKILIFCILFIVMAFGMAMGFLMGALPGRAAKPQQINTSTVIQQVQTLSQLVTVKYVMEKVVILEDAKWYGQDRLLMLAHGIVKAGVNLDQLQPGDIIVEGKKVRIILPQETITDAYLDDTKTQVIERETGTFRKLEKDLEQNARRIAVDDIRRAARYAGILKDARERAEIQLRGFFVALGFEQVEFASK